MQNRTLRLQICVRRYIDLMHLIPVLTALQKANLQEVCINTGPGKTKLSFSFPETEPAKVNPILIMMWKLRETIRGTAEAYMVLRQQEAGTDYVDGKACKRKRSKSLRTALKMFAEKLLEAFNAQ